jgi:hypothetical protein
MSDQQPTRFYDIKSSRPAAVLLLTIFVGMIAVPVADMAAMVRNVLGAE